MGTGRKQLRGCDYFVYVAGPDGKEKRLHKIARFGLCSKMKRPAAQEACDRFLITVNSGAAFADALKAEIFETRKTASGITARLSPLL
jgi:hypothetical protein